MRWKGKKELRGGRPDRGKIGQYRPCNGCGKSIYKAPSQLVYKRVICSKECWRKLSFSFKCVMCDTQVYTQPAQIKYRNRRTCSRRCNGLYLTQKARERHASGALTKHQIDRALRYSKEADDWRRAVFARDDYTCQRCGVRGGSLEAHHDLPFAYYPALRFEVLNGSTLCRPCHDLTKMSAKALRAIYEINQNL